jgi:23S rRNA (uridine2552-2'-O)-methyltransferase
MKKPSGNKGGAGGSGPGSGDGKRHSGRGLTEKGLKTRVKTAKGRRQSSTLWLERQLNDPYVKRARAEGYASRAAYKLQEIDDRYHLLHKGSIVIDLGAAPGGWTQVSVERTGSTPDDPLVVGIDYLEMSPVTGAVILQLDFLDDTAPQRLLEATKGRAPDVVLSDMAAPTIGHRRTDHLRTMHLVEVALDFAISVLKPGGHFLAKTFQGGTEAGLLDRMKRHFKSVHHVKPPASRDGSVELYLLAKDFKGKQETGHETEMTA